MKYIKGELLRRTLLNHKRLGDDIYRSSMVFDHPSDWPGDFVGRAILALVSLYHSLNGQKQEQDQILEQLNDIFVTMQSYINEDGYFGDVFNGVSVDEQQISGNSWFLRGLIEYYKLTKDDKYLKQINTICDKYLLKIARFYDEYPLTKREFGGVGGHTNKEIKGSWKVSTDIGCAFIMLDGMTAVYEINQNEELRSVIEKVINKFLEIDYILLECQTHATLSCSRGIFRFYKLTKDKKYLNHVIDIFSKYLKNGMTLDFSNINWFNRSDTWTEPCCVVDSMILAKNLYLETKQHCYLNLFNRIYVNALRTFQRDNGGAGCSTCAFDEKYELKMFMYEAFFCCTMRLGEGLKEIYDFSLIQKGNKLIVPGAFDVEFKDRCNEICIYNDYYSHKIEININKINGEKVIQLYVPGSNKLVSLTVNEIGSYKVDYKLETVVEDGIIFEGDMILTRKNEELPEYFILNGVNYTPIYDNSMFDEKTLESKIQYVK